MERYGQYTELTVSHYRCVMLYVAFSIHTACARTELYLSQCLYGKARTVTPQYSESTLIATLTRWSANAYMTMAE